MRLLSSLALLIGLLLIGLNVNSQPWKSKLPAKKENNYTFFDYQNAFNEYWSQYRFVDVAWYIDEKGNRRKASGYKQFKRAEWFWKYRVDAETGEFPKVTAMQKFNEWLKDYPQANEKLSTQGAWTSI